MIGHLELLMIDAKDISWGSAIAHFNLIAKKRYKATVGKPSQITLFIYGE